MNCSACGVAIPAGSTFCPKCGAKSGEMAPPQSGAAAAGLQPSTGNDEAESVLWSGRFSGKAMVGTWLLGLVVTIALGVAAVLFPAGMLIFIGVIGVLWLALLMMFAYRKLSVHYELSTQRFVHKKGILSQRTDRIETIDIDDVTVVQGFVERLFGVGTIKIVSSDRTDPELILVGIDEVARIADLLDDVRRKERRKHGVHIESV